MSDYTLGAIIVYGLIGGGILTLLLIDWEAALWTFGILLLSVGIVSLFMYGLTLMGVVVW